MSGFDCDRERLFHALAGELDAVERRRVRHHLRTCGRCREDRDEWLEILAAGRSGGGAADPALVARIEGRVALETRRRRRRRAALLALPSIAAGVLAFAFARPGSAPSVASPTAPAPTVASLRLGQENDGSWAGAVGPTAMALLALLQSGSPESAVPDRLRVDGAIHFLTRAREAGPLEEGVRCLALLESRGGGAAPAAPPLQAAFDHAMERMSAASDPRAGALVRAVIARGRRLGLRTDAGDRVAASFGVRGAGDDADRIDWEALAAALAEGTASAAAREPIRIASALLVAAGPGEGRRIQSRRG